MFGILPVVFEKVNLTKGIYVLCREQAGCVTNFRKVKVQELGGDSMSDKEKECADELAHDISPKLEMLPQANTVGQRIKEMRLGRGLSLSRLADLANVSKGYLHELENDQALKPSAEILYNISLALDTTVGFLLGRRRNPLEDKENSQTMVIPETLEQFAHQYRIPEEDKRRLACIKYRNQQPKSVEDWRYLYDTIKQVIK